MCYRTNSNLNRVCDVRLLYYKFNNLLKFTKAKVESICKNMSNRKKLNWKNNLSNDKKLSSVYIVTSLHTYLFASLNPVEKARLEEKRWLENSFKFNFVLRPKIEGYNFEINGEFRVNIQVGKIWKIK